jgi:HEPN domain-containing protein
MHTSQHKRDFSIHLLEKAEQLCQTGFYEAALVTAQSACEICCEQTFTLFLKQNDIAFIQSALRGLITNYNVSNGKTTKLYSAVARERIQDQPFWQAYKALVEHRNNVVHKGEPVSKEQAEGYLTTAKDIIA